MLSTLLPTLTSLAALPAILHSPHPQSPPLILSSIFSTLYHLSEKNARGHNLSGIALFDNDEVVLLLLDRVAAVWASVAVLRAVWRAPGAFERVVRRVIGGVGVALVAAGVGELGGGLWYAVFHSVWHVGIYWVAFVCCQEVDRGRGAAPSR
ncbi:hypothetical protein BDK51DRAFT_36547 [Blyttiomyces helicus]|uniref:Post-GPI attachment to proteins factor 3 n=1 Tax=Blyttiomyces helicus TaxID=388810 RepID=A0A4P9WI48_9FUNG|nr:hypothetical protein BDK51DRAFT_36547 [Blyttiomyces helicus]|eukprot:RKO92434.1 hypothetical protein BDK51DRAFT_36547 [Blyttiomyces helicus]